MPRPFKKPCTGWQCVLVLSLSFLLTPLLAPSAGASSWQQGPGEETRIVNSTATMSFFISEAPFHEAGGFEPQVLAGPGKDGREWYYINSPSGARWSQSGNLWISKDDGVTWTWMPKGPGSDSLGGSGDSCAAIARDGTIYFSDLLYPASVSIETSSDGGSSWVRNPQASVTPVDDRQWLAMGPTIGGTRLSKTETLYMAYNQATSGLWIMSSQYTSHGLAWKPGNHGRPVTKSVYFRDGMAVDSHDGTVYLANTAQSGGLSVFVSTDGADTFRQEHVMDGSMGMFQNLFVVPDVDAAGNLYLVWTDQHNVTLGISGDRGGNWRFLTVASGNGTRVFPWVAAGDAGRAGVVWYETNETGDPNTMDNATWDVMAAVTTDALAQNVTFDRSVVAPAVHCGTIRTTGSSGTSDRDLGDFMSCDVDRLGRLLVAFGNDGNDGPNKWHSKVMFARQTGGPFLKAGMGPVASFTYGVDGLKVAADGKDSYDMNGLGITAFRWDWGDGTNTTDATGTTASHVYKKSGRYDLTLQVTDPDNMSDASTVRLKLAAPPTASLGGYVLPAGAAVAVAAAVYIFWRRRRGKILISAKSRAEA